MEMEREPHCIRGLLRVSRQNPIRCHLSPINRSLALFEWFQTRLIASTETGAIATKVLALSSVADVMGGPLSITLASILGGSKAHSQPPV